MNKYKKNYCCCNCDYCKSELEQIQLQQEQEQLQAQVQNDTDTITFDNVGSPTINVNVSCPGGDLDLVRASAFKASKTENQPVEANASVKVLYQNEEYDLANEYNPATSIFTPTTDGVYSVIGSILFFPDDLTQDYRSFIQIIVNGTVTNAFDNDFFGGGLFFGNVVAVSAILQLQAGDQVEIFAQSSIAGEISASTGGTHFEAARFPSPTT